MTLRAPHPSAWQSRTFPRTPLVGMVVSTYLMGKDHLQRTDSLFSLLYALRGQTYNHWNAIVVHDGPDPASRVKKVLEQVEDERLSFWITPEQSSGWGGRWRSPGADRVAGDYVGFVNEDTWYAPVYLEAMADLLVNQGCDFAYCNSVHSHFSWAPWTTAAAKTGLDACAFVTTRELILATKWTDFSAVGDGTFIDELVAKAKKVGKCDAFLHVHN